MRCMRILPVGVQIAICTEPRPCEGETSLFLFPILFTSAVEVASYGPNKRCSVLLPISAWSHLRSTLEPRLLSLISYTLLHMDDLLIHIFPLFIFNPRFLCPSPGPRNDGRRGRNRPSRGQIKQRTYVPHYYQQFQFP